MFGHGKKESEPRITLRFPLGLVTALFLFPFLLYEHSRLGTLQRTCFMFRQGSSLSFLSFVLVGGAAFFWGALPANAPEKLLGCKTA